MPIAPTTSGGIDFRFGSAGMVLDAIAKLAFDRTRWRPGELSRPYVRR
jgi:hypothetical protein